MTAVPNISILTQREVEQPVPQGPAVGIDVGVARFASLSDGSHVDPLNVLKKHAARLAKYQRRMARKTKFSSNWKKEGESPRPAYSHRHRECPQ